MWRLDPPIDPSTRPFSPVTAPSSSTPNLTNVRRHLLGITALMFLLIAAGLVVYSRVADLSPALWELLAMSLRVGTMLFLGWLAYDQLLKVPRWAWFVFPAIVLAVVLKQFKLLLLFVPLFLAIAILKPKPRTRRKR